MSFHDALYAHGLRPSSAVVPDGKIHRCPTADHPKRRNGAWLWSVDSAFGWYMDWTTDADPVTWRADGKGGEAPLLDYQRIRRRNEDRQRKQEAAIVRARAFYAASSPLVGGHPYLAAKGLDMAGCSGLRVDADGWLVVPMMRSGAMQSVQRVAPDGEKRFWTGAPTSGASYAVDRRGATLTVLCEGLATGLAIYAAVPLCRVVVAFTAGNLPKVAAQIIRRGMVCVAADNDHRTEDRMGKNPGVMASGEAGRVLGCSVAVPEGIDGTDWCDYRTERMGALSAPVYGKRRPTAGAVRRTVDGEIARAMMAAARFLCAAGFREGAG